MSSKEIPEGFKMTELGMVPEEWEVVRFERSILKKRIKVGKVRQQDYKELGKYPIVDQGQNHIAGYWEEAEDLYQGDLPVIIFGDHTRIFKFVDFPFVCGADGTKVLVPNTSLFTPLFFYFVLSNLDIPSRGYNRHYSLLKEKQIIRPPLPEQQKIAAVLSAVQSAKEKTEQVIKGARELKKSLMKHLFTYGPVPLNEAENVPLKETEIGLVPEAWDVKPLVDVATLQRGKDLPKQKQIPGPYPIVGSSGILGYHNESVCAGLGVVTGRSGSIGKLTYVEEDYWPHNTGLYVKDFHDNNPKFIYYLLHLLDFKKYATGVSVPTLNRNFIHSALLSLPPISTQQKIASILSAVDEKIEAEENKKKALEELFKTLLNILMTGKLRVHPVR